MLRVGEAGLLWPRRYLAEGIIHPAVCTSSNVRIVHNIAIQQLILQMQHHFLDSFEECVQRHARRLHEASDILDIRSHFSTVLPLPVGTLFNFHLCFDVPWLFGRIRVIRPVATASNT